jgi:hypothetical protein
MPAAYLCPVCNEKVADDQEFTLVEASTQKIRTHLECAKKRAAGQRPAAGVAPVTSRGARRRR